MNVCEGNPVDVWHAMPSSQREAYLSAVLDALIVAHPGATDITLTVRAHVVVRAAAEIRSGNTVINTNSQIDQHVEAAARFHGRTKMFAGPGLNRSN